MSHVDDGTLHAYLDGELAPAEAQGVDAHLAQCPACRGRIDEERALITRAGELLALAAPPDRELPPFRAGDIKPASRLWWQVRLPLAWAATVALALGIGSYLGRELKPLPQAQTASDTQPAESHALRAPVSSAPVSSDLAKRESRAKLRGPARTPPAAQPAAPALAARQEADGFARERRAQVAAVPRDTALRAAAPAPAPAPAPQAGVAIFVDGQPVAKGSSISVDSARALLGADPVAVPGAPIRAIYRARQIGYAAVVIVEQALDSSTLIELVQRRPTPLNLEAVVVTAPGAERAPDSVARLNEAQRKAEARADAPAAKSNARVAPLDAQDRSPRRVGTLEIHIAGPLPADSLQKLLRLVQPVKP